MSIMRNPEVEEELAQSSMAAALAFEMNHLKSGSGYRTACSISFLKWSRIHPNLPNTVRDTILGP